MATPHRLRHHARPRQLVERLTSPPCEWRGRSRSQRRRTHQRVRRLLLEEDLPATADSELRQWQAFYGRAAASGGAWAAWEARAFESALRALNGTEAAQSPGRSTGCEAIVGSFRRAGRFTADLTRSGCCSAARVSGESAKVYRYLITIQGVNFEDVENVELPKPPQPGETIETHLGTCIVTSTESMPAESEYAGKIICRLP